MPDYVQIQYRSLDNPGRWHSVYLLSVDDRICSALTCWGQQFDEIFKRLNEPDFGRVYSTELRKVWPTFFGFVDNALDERFGDGAITEISDPDDFNRKWVLAVLFRTSTSSEEFENRAISFADQIYGASLTMKKEFQNKIPASSHVRAFLKGGAIGARQGMELVDKWKGRLDWLAPLIESSD